MSSSPTTRALFIFTSTMSAILYLAPAIHAEALSLDQAVALALKHNSALRQARARVQAAEASRKKARAGYGPSLAASANLAIWDSEFKVDFGSSLPAAFKSLIPPGSSLDLVAREQITAQINVTLTQPITPLYQVHKGQALAAIGRDAAKLGLERARQSIVASAKKAYLNALRAQAGLAIASTAVKQVQASVKNARAFERAGLIGRNDLLKAEVALSQAEEGKIKAEAGVALSRSALAAVMGISPGKDVTLSETMPVSPPAFAMSLADCVERAQRSRPELAIARAQVRIAGGKRAIEKWNYMPQVVALAQYQHTEGAGEFLPKNAFFVGGALNWKIFEWGATHYAVKAAEQEAAVARYALPLLRSRIHLEVKKAFLDLQVARKTIAVASRRVAQAREGYRIEKARFNKQAATATNLLDAQLALTRSELSYTNARYSWHIARAALDQAMGVAVQGGRQ